MGGGAFDPATLFSIDAPVRVTTLATDDMIIKRLTQVRKHEGCLMLCLQQADSNYWMKWGFWGVPKHVVRLA
jgi:hypothetical protein